MYSIESADGPVIFTFSYEIQSTMGCTHDCICDMNWTANLAVLLPGATEAATIFGVSWRILSGDCLLRPPTALCEETARVCGIDTSMVGALVAVLAEMSGWGESVYDFCKERSARSTRRWRGSRDSYNPMYDARRALFEGMHNAWTHYLNSLVRLQRISDFKRLNAIGKAEFHMRPAARAGAARARQRRRLLRLPYAVSRLHQRARLIHGHAQLRGVCGAQQGLGRDGRRPRRTHSFVRLVRLPRPGAPVRLPSAAPTERRTESRSAPSTRRTAPTARASATPPSGTTWRSSARVRPQQPRGARRRPRRLWRPPLVRRPARRRRRLEEHHALQRARQR